MLTSTMTQKGQVTIPIEFRQLFDLHPGDHVKFAYEDNVIIITKVKNDITASFGHYQAKHKVTLDEIQKAIEKGPLNDLD